MTGGDLSHAMGPNVNLGPLLSELGASVPARGFYFIASQMDHVDEIVQAAANDYLAVFDTLHSFTSRAARLRPNVQSEPIA
jgi:FMN reductase